VQQVDWKRDWSQCERDRTADYVTNRLARTAVGAGLSLSVWAVAGPELVKELKYIRADEDDPCRYALVRAVLDWHHTGLTSPIPWSVAVDLVNRAYLDYPASDDDLTEAVNWATSPIGVGGRRGRYSLLTRQRDALTVNDFIEDWDGRHQQSPIPDATWLSAIANAPSFDSLWNIGFTAHFEGQTAVEQTAMQTLAKASDTNAMVNLGLLLLRDRDPAAAQAWWERAAAAGNTDARSNLEVPLADRDSAAPQAWSSAMWERWSVIWASWGRTTTIWTEFYFNLAFRPFETTQELAKLIWEADGRQQEEASADWYEAEAKVWGPNRKLISDVAHSMSDTAGKPPEMANSFRVAAQKYVASLILRRNLAKGLLLTYQALI
jgi:hypothetical protein